MTSCKIVNNFIITIQLIQIIIQLFQLFEKTERLADEFPGIFPASVVTRSIKAKKEAIKEQGKEEMGLSGIFLENIDGKFEKRNKENAEKPLMRNESRNVTGNIPGKQKGESKSVISRQNLHLPGVLTK